MSPKIGTVQGVPKIGTVQDVPKNIGQNRVSKIGRVQDVQNRTVLGVPKYRTDAEQALKANYPAKDRH